MIKPKGFDPSKRYPVLMYVYGEPHGQTVRDAWPGARGLWHWMLAQRGFVVASVDNRGTNVPRGRDIDPRGGPSWPQRSEGTASAGR